MPSNALLRRRATLWASCVAACLLLAGCGGAQQPQTKRYQMKGTVVEIDKSQGHLVVDHEEIPGFMGAMTMPYPVADARTLDQVGVGDQITADVVVTEGQGPKLENVVIVKKGTGTLPAKPGAANLQQLQQGTAVPNFVMVNQDGKQISMDGYPGKSVLLTFIYTRCPLADYCPLMTHNFAEIEKELAKTPDAYGKTHLLSISFDPKNDTPDVLRSYGLSYVTSKGKNAFTHWEFAAVPEKERQAVDSFFDVFYNESDGQITHSMSTAIIGPDGKLYKWYDGNEWKPADVLADLLNSLHSQS